MVGTFVFDEDRLMPLARAHRDAYAIASPFPHVVLDDFLPADVATRLAGEFPTPAPDWAVFDAPSELHKYQLREETSLPPYTRQVCWAFNSAVFLRFLTALTGIDCLIADPALWGGGLHQTRRGGRLAIHADFHRHPTLDIDRRLNVILFLNPTWRTEWNGDLELWDRDMSNCVKHVAPILNRCVIFNTTDSALHGHPSPLACPEDMTRRSLALYYYSNGRPADEVMKRWNTTLYRHRPGTGDDDNLLRLQALYYLRRCVPPIVIDLKRRLFGRRDPGR